MAAQSSPAKSSARNAEPVERPSLTLKRRFNAAPEKVYAAWADPQKLAQWFGPGPVEEGSVKADIDLRVGGRYRISFNAKGTYNEVGGVYREVVPNRAAGVQLGMAFHAGAGIAGDDLDEAGRQRHAAHLPARTVRR